MKKIIKLTESDITRIVRRVIKEQGLIMPMLGTTNAPKPNVNVSRGSSFDLSKGQNFTGKTPKSEIEGGDSGCLRSFQAMVKDFMSEAKFWKGGVDEEYMNKIIQKITDGYKRVGYYWWTTNPSDVLNTFGKIKTEAGMGYLLRNFKYNGKNLYQTFETDHRFPWAVVAKILLDNGFYLEKYYAGCREEDGRVHS